MIVFVVSLTLYAIALGLLAWLARLRGRRSAYVALGRSWQEFLRLVPRLAVGVIGAGFLARLLPQDAVVAWLGRESGWTGVMIATLAGALTPGGPVVGYSLGAAALKAGAGMPQVMAYVTGWALYTVQRMLVWELNIMPRRFVLLRILVSLPFPFIIAGMALLFGGR